MAHYRLSATIKQLDELKLAGRNVYNVNAEYAKKKREMIMRVKNED